MTVRVHFLSRYGTQHLCNLKQSGLECSFLIHIQFQFLVCVCACVVVCVRESFGRQRWQLDAVQLDKDTIEAEVTAQSMK